MRLKACRRRNRGGEKERKRERRKVCQWNQSHILQVLYIRYDKPYPSRKGGFTEIVERGEWRGCVRYRMGGRLEGLTSVVFNGLKSLQPLKVA